ncbi:hypothetical protein BG910_02090 [Neisseria chenwenguii]|uniref:Toxin-antitoxin system YwqK family antitoxin n=1 Tax=Neisseria chenwenguii TaxID=1853278 RepID=A0A220S0F2_9NEIS|nr:hypothetical protein [Neisseria chenwenguii]ASK26695.1 hypothetical protein BG910_02090 [Neisseria chenwenguii]
MKFHHLALATLTAVSLSGCFLANQVREKNKAECTANAANINNLPAGEQQRLIKKCGWKTQADAEMVARLCAAPVLQQPATPIQNGIVNERLPNGLVLQYKVKNGKPANTIDIYYPNGNLETHMKFRNSLANGWSQGYAPDGAKRTEFLYKKGRAVKYKTFRPDGSLNTKGSVDCQ